GSSCRAAPCSRSSSSSTPTSATGRKQSRLSAFSFQLSVSAFSSQLSVSESESDGDGGDAMVRRLAGAADAVRRYIPQSPGVTGIHNRVPYVQRDARDQ